MTRFEKGERIVYNGTDPRYHDPMWTVNWAEEDDLLMGKSYTVEKVFASGAVLLEGKQYIIDAHCFKKPSQCYEGWDCYGVVSWNENASIR